MANEITLTSKISATKGSVTGTNAVSTKTQSMQNLPAVDAICLNTQTTLLTTTVVANTGTVETATYDYFVNICLRSTSAVADYCSISQDAANLNKCGKLYAGEFFQARIPAATLIYLTPSVATRMMFEVIAIEAGNPNT